MHEEEHSSSAQPAGTHAHMHMRARLLGTTCLADAVLALGNIHVEIAVFRPHPWLCIKMNHNALNWCDMANVSAPTSIARFYESLHAIRTAIAGAWKPNSQCYTCRVPRGMKQKPHKTYGIIALIEQNVSRSGGIRIVTLKSCYAGPGTARDQDGAGKQAQIIEHVCVAFSGHPIFPEPTQDL